MPTESIALRALEWLFTYGVHSTLLLGAAWLVTTRGLVRSERVKDIVWKTAIAGGVITASLQVGAGLEPFGGHFQLERRPVAIDSALEPEVPLFEPNADLASHLGHEERAALLTGREAGIGTARTQGPPSEPPAALPSALGRVGWTRWVLGSWIGGGAALLLVLGAAWRRLRERLAGRRRVAEGPMPGLLALVRRRAGLRRAVRLTTSPRLEAPIALGTVFPQVCVPTRVLTDLTIEMQESVLAHEVAHIARFDPFWLGFSRLLETVFFFQPLNRLARRRLQECSEFLCDDLAVDYTGNRIALARCLAQVAGWLLGERRAIPACGMADLHSPLGERVTRILDRGGRTEGRPRWLLPVGAALLGATVMLAPGFSFTTAEADPDRADAFDAPRPLPAVPPEATAMESSAPSPGAARGAAEELLASFASELATLDRELAEIRAEAEGREVSAAVRASLAELERRVRSARARNGRIRELLSRAVLPGDAGASLPSDPLPRDPVPSETKEGR